VLHLFHSYAMSAQREQRQKCFILLTKLQLSCEIKKILVLVMVSILTISPQGPTIVGTGSGTPEVPELPSARGYSWTTLSRGVINTETWSSRLGVGRGANNPTPLKTAVTEPQERRLRPDMGCRAIGWILTL
jgi:hypothetical protein